MKQRLFIIIAVIFMFLGGCADKPAPPATEAAVALETAVSPISTPQPTETPEPTAPPTATPQPLPTETATSTPEPGLHEWIPPIETELKLSRNPVSAAEIFAGEALAAVVYPYVDYLAEALSHQLVSEPVDPVISTEAPTLNEGMVKTFWILNTDSDTWGEVEMRLLGISDHAYFWFDTNRDPNPDNVQEAMTAFESVYDPLRAVFGTENVPGVDGDPRVYILHASGPKLCNVSEDFAHTCGIGGYFFGVNQIPSTIIAESNEHEGLIMNLDSTSAPLGSDGYQEVMGHEFRHLIEYWYDKQGETWEVEGSAVMAEEILGFADLNLVFANLFMAEPDLQLNTWAEGNLSFAHYGQGYMINRYIYDRFGEAFYSQWQQDPGGGFSGLDLVLTQNGQVTSAVQVWQDWLVTLVTHANPNAPAHYRFEREFNLDPVGQTPISSFPRTIEDEVAQFGADIYRFRSEKNLGINFTGTTKTAVIGRLPTSGQYFIYSGRAPGALSKLTHSFDLTEVESATLEYDTFFKFSNTFGFGYVVISTDGGVTWQGLVGQNMRGDEIHHDPLNLALTDRFYTGVSPGGNWNRETIDLTPYAGQEVLIRFESDGNDRSIGLAIDNLAIPEIDFYDDFETETGWQTDGWVRTTAYIPQTFHLQLIIFENGVPVVTAVSLDETNSGEFEIMGLTSENEEAYLIVSAEAPDTLETAAYRFQVSQK